MATRCAPPLSSLDLRRSSTGILLNRRYPRGPCSWDHGVAPGSCTPASRRSVPRPDTPCHPSDQWPSGSLHDEPLDAIEREKNAGKMINTGNLISARVIRGPSPPSPGLSGWRPGAEPPTQTRTQTRAMLPQDDNDARLSAPTIKRATTTRLGLSRIAFPRSPVHASTAPRASYSPSLGHGRNSPLAAPQSLPGCLQ